MDCERKRGENMAETAGNEEKRKGIPYINIPSVDALLSREEMQPMLERYPRYFVLKAVRATLDGLRRELRSGDELRKLQPSFDESELIMKAQIKLNEYVTPGIQRCVNGTGIILHTGLGRAVLPKRAVDALRANEGFVNVQASLKTGKRSQRDVAVEKLLCEITGAEAAAVTNNNAAATMLALNTVAEGKEAIISRGQLIEIGGSFRLPDIMKKSGVKMVEVGTTNRTYLRDYENAITPETGCIFRAHTSNYRIQGFTHQPELKEIVGLAKKHSIPFIDDLGAGAFFDLAPFGLSDEPLIQKSIKAGSDLVLFSGDKLVGGPQAGILLGKKELIKKLRSNPLTRVLRVCKLTLMALEATLFLFLDREKAVREIPSFQMLSRSVDELQKSALELVEQLRKEAPFCDYGVEDEVSYMGSGSLPMEDIKTKVVSAKCSGIDCEELARILREQKIPVFSRIKDNKVLIDMRTLLEGEHQMVVQTFKAAQKSLEGR